MSLRQDGKVQTTREIAYDRALQCRLSTIYYGLRLKQAALLNITIPLLLALLGLLALPVLNEAHHDAIAIAISLVCGNLFFFKPVNETPLHMLLVIFEGKSHNFESLYLKGEDDPVALENELHSFNQLQQMEAKFYPNPSRRLTLKAQNRLYEEIGYVKDTPSS